MLKTLPVILSTALVRLVSRTARQVLVEGSTCNSIQVTEPLSSRGATGWIGLNVGAGKRRQGHIMAEVEAWGHEYVVVYGGTSVRNDDVNDVVAKGSGVSILDNAKPWDWTELEMIGYHGYPPPLFRPGSFVWINSLFLVCGHTSEPFEVTDAIWRADIQGFQEAEATEGLWRPVNAVKTDDLRGEVLNIPRYGHSSTVFNTGEVYPTEVWVAIIGGMTGTQGSIDDDLILHLSESSETFHCYDRALNTTSPLTCAERTHARPTESQGEWWYLRQRLHPSDAVRPGARSYHAAASLASDGRGGASCVYVFGGRDYEMSVLFSDLWSLCPVSGFLGSAEDTTFRWTELSPRGSLPLGRYGATLSAGIKDAQKRLLLSGGTGRFPNSYMADAFTHEYDAYMDVWVDSLLGDGSVSYPVGRRDHTLEWVGHEVVLIAGINNDEEALRDMWRVNYSSPVCGSGNYMFFCEDTAAPVCAVCPDGTATERASYTCQTCTSGYYAQKGAEQCTPCPAGKHGTGEGGITEATACSDCPAGTSTTNGVGTPSVDGCIECKAGTYSLGGAMECTLCPSGFYSSSRATECIPCAPGTYRIRSSTSGYCASCAVGTYAPFQQASVCLDCPQGYYIESGGETSCSPCPAGTAGSDIAGGALVDACVSCKAGEYASEDGLSACEECPAGTASSIIGADDARVCEMCPAGTFASSGASTCQDCAAGQYSDQAGAEVCDSCPVGTYSDRAGSDSVGTCLFCPQGSTTRGAGSSSSIDCAPCAPGTRSVSLGEGGGCEACPRGEFTSTNAEAQELNCTRCGGGFYADTIGTEECAKCAEKELSFSGHAVCTACTSNTSCPLGPNGEACSGRGHCVLGVCDCSVGFNNVDCSNGTCDGCSGVFGFDFASSLVATAESAGTVNLTLVRLTGTDGEITVEVNVTGGNTTHVLDYGGAWPTQVLFLSGQSEAVVPFSTVHDDIPNEGCEFVAVRVSFVSAGGSAIVNGGINDVSTEAVILIEESDFTSAILETALVDGADVGGGGLSPATADVIIADNEATWGSNLTLSVVGTTPTDRSLALPLELLLLLESHSSISTDLERLIKLLPGLAAEMQSTYSSTKLGAAAFANVASSYSYDLLQPLSNDVYPVAVALDTAAADSSSKFGDPPGAQVAALYEAATDDTVNGAGWGDTVFRVVAVVTGSHFAQEVFFDLLDPSTWVLPHGVTVSELRYCLHSSGVHPVFLLTDESLKEAYGALVAEIGFGAVVAFDSEKAIAESFNDHFLPRALADGLKILYSQASLIIESDDGGFVSSTTPAPDASRNVSAGSETTFHVNMSSDAVSSRGGGNITLSFQGHKTIITVVREFTSCHTPTRSRVTGADAAASDASRSGWLQGFYPDEATRWTFGSVFSVGQKIPGPFGVAADVLMASCPVGCSDEQAYQDIVLDIDSQLPVVLKAYFTLFPGSIATTASATLRAVYSDGSTSNEEISTLDFGASSDAVKTGTWTQRVDPTYPTRVFTSARVTLSFSGTGEAAFAGVGLFAHPNVACKCSAKYYLDVNSAPARGCSPQPECTYFEGWCVYCPAGYKCPKGGVLTACSDGEYSMGGSVECSPCPEGWLCSEGLGVPCGYGTHPRPITTNIQEDEGASSRSPGDVYGGTCSGCPAGSACPGAGLREECSPGTFSPGGAASSMCMPCPPGTFANGTAEVECEDCAAGYTSIYGASECFKCSPGFTSEAGQHPCQPCGVGTYAGAGNPECKPCEEGYYADAAALWTCQACPASTTTISTGSTSKVDCL